VGPRAVSLFEAYYWAFFVVLGGRMFIKLLSSVSGSLRDKALRSPPETLRYFGGLMMDGVPAIQADYII